MGNALAMRGQRNGFGFAFYFLLKSLQSIGNILAMCRQHIGNALGRSEEEGTRRKEQGGKSKEEGATRRKEQQGGRSNKEEGSTRKK